jgi:hypothetical protein
MASLACIAVVRIRWELDMGHGVEVEPPSLGRGHRRREEAVAAWMRMEEWGWTATKGGERGVTVFFFYITTALY